MDSLHEIYMETTNPKTNYSRLLHIDIAVSILLHTIAYITMFFIVTKLFKVKVSQDIYFKLVIFLLVIMSLGYFGRLYRVKSLYASLLKRNMSEKDALESTKNMINNAYFTYYFIG